METLVHGARAGFDPGKALRLIADHGVGNLFTTPTAIRAMMGVSEAAPGLRGAAACSAGEPLNPEAIAWWNRTVGCPVLDYYGLSESYRCAATSRPSRSARLHGLPARLGGGHPRPTDEQPAPGRAGRDLPQGPLQPALRSATGTGPRTRRDFGGDWFHRDTARQDEDGYVWYSGRADDVIISAGYRIGPFEVESTLLGTRRWPSRRWWPAPTPSAATSSRRSSASSPAPSRATSWSASSSGTSASACPSAYPRQVEFVDDLPKTLTGKIRARAAPGRRAGRARTAAAGLRRCRARDSVWAMYDTRWPRPGPAMAAVAAVLGLVAGIVLGLSSTAPQAQASPPVETTVAPTTTTLPEEFHTVILGSYDERDNADGACAGPEPGGGRRPARPGGVRPRHQVGGLQRPVRDREEAEAHRQELSGSASRRASKHVTGSD